MAMADAFMPGTARWQMGSQILNKTIEFGSKVAGIGVSEIGDFFSIGDNPRLTGQFVARPDGWRYRWRQARATELGRKKPPDAMTGDQASKPRPAAARVATRSTPRSTTTVRPRTAPAAT